MPVSLLARDPTFALRIRGTRITLVSSAPTEDASIQVTDPVPQNFVVNRPLELVRFLEQAERGTVPTAVMLYDSQDQEVSDVTLWLNAGRVVLNFTHLGSATAAFILLVCGYTPAELDWSKVSKDELTGNCKAPNELGAFFRWHLKKA